MRAIRPLNLVACADALRDESLSAIVKQYLATIVMRFDGLVTRKVPFTTCLSMLRILSVASDWGPARTCAHRRPCFMQGPERCFQW